MTMSMMKVRPFTRSWLRCRSRSVIACATVAAVLARTPDRLFEHPIDGCLAQAGLPGDLTDRVGMSHGYILLGS